MGSDCPDNEFEICLSEDDFCIKGGIWIFGNTNLDYDGCTHPTSLIVYFKDDAQSPLTKGVEFNRGISEIKWKKLSKQLRSIEVYDIDYLKPILISLWGYLKNLEEEDQK